MNRPDFEKCTKLATELLYAQNVTDRILDIRKLNYEKSIIFDTIQNYAFLTKTPLSAFSADKNGMLKDGCTLILNNGQYLILYNNQINNFEHLNWTLAHEVGHIYLGHTEDTEIAEIEANFFSAQLFMPEYSIYMMAKEYGPITKHDLIEIFGVSEYAAEKRITTMRKKSLFRAATIDKEIWKKQKRRVDLYYECQKDTNEYRFSLDYLLELDFEYEQTLRLEAAYSMT